MPELYLVTVITQTRYVVTVKDEEAQANGAAAARAHVERVEGGGYDEQVHEVMDDRGVEVRQIPL